MKTLTHSVFGARHADQRLWHVHGVKERFWSGRRERHALEVFHAAEKQVPAYKDFLKKHAIDAHRINTWEDFQQVPATSKKNYLSRYSMEDLAWNGTLAKPLVFTATSGTTGEPFYFPRTSQLDWQSSVAHELFLQNGFVGGKEKGPTLVIVAFGMGVWIGGLLTYKAFEIAGIRGGYPISILPTGINKKEIFNALKKLAPHFHQTIITGYAPFIKDIIDESPAQGIDFKKLNARFIFAAEAFTESFRDYIAEHARIKNIYRDTMNIYGSADIGTMAYETPAAILIRRLLMKNKHAFHSVFSGIEKTPTLAQYNPLFIAFEAPRGEILLTGDSAIPLVRYAIGDHGGILSFGEMMAKLKEQGIDFYQEAKRAAIDPSIGELPFVYIYERADMATTLYGLQIYPEVIREALLHPSCRASLTGKFTMITKFDEKQNQYLEINIELRQGGRNNRALEKLAQETIVDTLRAKSSEFRELSDHLKERAVPRVLFWSAEDPLHFKPGAKQKWVKKEEGS